MENNSIDIKDKIVSQQTHGTSDITCGGSLESPTHRLSKKIEKSIFNNLSLIEPTEEERDFIYRDEDENVMVASKESGKTKTVWRKITNISEYVSGEEYLFVYEPTSVIFDSSLETLDSKFNIHTVTITDGEIEDSADVSSKSFVISDMGDGAVSILAKNGKYINRIMNSNGLDSLEIPSANHFDENFHIIAIGGRKLAFNTDMSQTRFRYLSTTAADICIYKRTSVVIPDYYTWKGLISNDDAIPQETLNEIFRPMCNDRNLIEECCDEDTGYVIDCEDDTQTGE